MADVYIIPYLVKNYTVVYGNKLRGVLGVSSLTKLNAAGPAPVSRFKL
ncbi:MAG: hypothetical protein LBV17_12830 [Treponema sp.]|jgi:hypothetical protein|nr:hypothetical protein [Treponema sp.]